MQQSKRLQKQKHKRNGLICKYCYIKWEYVFMIKIVQGFNLRYKVLTENSILVIKGDGIKYIVDRIETVNDTFWVIADKEMTKEWIAR